jgi:hypothetical protein
MIAGLIQLDILYFVALGAFLFRGSQFLPWTKAKTLTPPM